MHNYNGVYFLAWVIIGLVWLWLAWPYIVQDED